MNPGKKSPSDKSKRSYFFYWSQVVQLVITVGILGYLGYLGDKAIGFRFPLFLLLGIIAGLSGGIYRLLKSLK